MNDYKGFKSQALDFNVYSDGIDVIAVTPQHALTRENGGTQYYSTSGWQGLTIETTVEDALANTQDAWWAGAAFETLLNVYWDADDNAYPNILWTREETMYSSGNPTYSTPTKDTGGSAIGKWCLDNDRTIINGAHIGTGTIDADSIKANSITTKQLAAEVLSANNIIVSGSGENKVTLENQLEDINTRFTTVDTTIDQLQFGVQNLVTSANAVVTNPGDSTVTDGIYTVYTPQFQHGIKLAPSIFELNKSYVISFKLKDLYGESNRTDGGIIPEDIKPNTKITAIGGHCLPPWGAFEIEDAIIDGKTPAADESYDTGYSLDLDKTIHTVVLFLKKVDGTITGDDAAVYIQPSRNYNGEPGKYTTLCDIWDLVVAESNAIPTSWVNYQYTTTKPMETPDSSAVWADSFPDEWIGKSSVWQRTKTQTSTGHISYGEPVILSTADAARIAADMAGESVGDWCLVHDVTVIDGANLMTGTIDASKVKVTNLDASQITAGMFTVGTDHDGNKKLEGSEIIFQAGYAEGENNTKEPLVKIGGFKVDNNSLSSVATGSTTGITLSTAGDTTPVIKAGDNFKVSPEGEITASAGTIGGFTIARLTDDNNKNPADGLYSMSTPSADNNNKRNGVGMVASAWSGDPAFWAGYTGTGNTPWEATQSWPNNTKFYVTQDGALVAKSGRIGVFSISAEKTDGTNNLSTGPTKIGDRSNKGLYLGENGITFANPWGDTDYSGFETATLALSKSISNPTLSSNVPTLELIRTYGDINSTDTYSDYHLDSGILQSTGLVFNTRKKGQTWDYQDAFIIRHGYDGDFGSDMTGNGAYDIVVGDENGYGSLSISMGESYGLPDLGIVMYRNATSTNGYLWGTWRANSFTSTGSDANLKHEIESLPGKYTSLFDNLKPVRFKYNDGTSNRYHTGFIAQDVEQAILDSGLTTNDVAGYIKEADIVNDNGVVTKEGTRSIRYGEFVALNTDQIQKLKSRVTELEATVAELTKLVNEKLNQT